MISINYFVVKKRFFFLMSVWMNWKRLMKHYCLEEFYNNLNMEDIVDVDYMHAKSVCKDFKLKINMFLKTAEKCVQKFII